jgi:hypothetical protein
MNFECCSILNHDVMFSTLFFFLVRRLLFTYIYIQLLHFFLSHKTANGSLTQAVEEPLEYVDFGDIYAENEKATLISLVVKRRESSGESTMHFGASFNTSATGCSECQLLFQTENENLRLGLVDDDYAFYNELFNQTGCVDHVTFMQGQLEQTLVLVLTPNPANDSHDDLNPPTSLRDFQGVLSLTIDETVANFAIRGRLCSSFMSSDRTELSFEDCEPNQTYVREFSIRNK